MPDSTLSLLITATRDTYHALANGAETADAYATLVSTYAAHGLDANVAESSVDWFEGGTLADDLTDAIAR